MQFILKLCTFIILLCYGQHATAQHGVNYEELSFQDALEKAGKEKKFVFMDTYTEWCTICKMVDKKIFSQKEVADFFNEHFVCVKYDMEKGEGLALRKRYGIVGFPTFFILNEKGEVLHKFIGYYSAEDMIKEGMKYNDNRNSSVALARRYAEGDRGKEFMFEYFMFLYKSLDTQRLQVGDELCALLSDEEKILEKYWMFFSYPEFASYGSVNATYLLNNYDRFCASLGKEVVEKRVLDLFLPPLRAVLESNSSPVNITLEKLLKMEMEIKGLPDDIKGNIQLYIDLVRDFLRKDYAGMIKICDRKLEVVPNNGGVGIYMGLMDVVCENVSVDQKESWFKLGERLIKKVKNVSLQKRVQDMIQQYK